MGTTGGRSRGAVDQRQTLAAQLAPMLGESRLLDARVRDVLAGALAALDATSLGAALQSCRALREAASEDIWEGHCMTQHWRLKTCGPGSGVATWRALYAAFSCLTAEQRWEVEWQGGGFGNRLASEYFAASTVPRRCRSREVRFSVGQVILNRSGPYHGVVVGWDEITKVPPNWPSLQKSRQPWLSKPHYSVLAHGGGSYYIVDDNSELAAVPFEIDNLELQGSFTHFNGQVYLPIAPLQAAYPEDDALGPLLRRRFCNHCGASCADSSCRRLGAVSSSAGRGAETIAALTAPAPTRISCSRCGFVCYCSEECQHTAWKLHQRHCSPTDVKSS